MKWLVHLQAYSVLGTIQVVVTTREVLPEGSTEVVQVCATVVPDDGTDDMNEFACDALTAALERLSCH